MIISFRELAKAGSARYHERIDIGGLIKGRRDIVQSGPLQVELTAEYKAGAVHVQGMLSVELELVCSRCLGQFRQTLNIPVREMFVQKTEGEEPDEDDEVHPVSEDKFDLKPYIEEIVFLELPYIPLCDEACKGLCSVCGKNRNEEQCGCSQERIDPRLAGLADFFKK